MKFKHTCNVLLDNFPLIFKQLLFRLVIWIVFGVLYAFCIYPLVNTILNSTALTDIVEGVKTFATNFLSGNFDDIADISESIKIAFDDLMQVLNGEIGRIVLTCILLAVIHLISKWITGMCNYGCALCLSEKMALRSNSPFLATTIRSFPRSSIYNLIYVVLSFLYDIVVIVIMGALLYLLVVFAGLPIFLALFIFTAVFVFAIAVKMTFTTDWVPALTRGRMTQLEAMEYTFSRKGKNTMNVLANYVIIVLLIFSVNVLAFISTIGVGILITIPASYVLILAFEMVNYFDRERITYSIGPDSMVQYKPDHEPTKEEFFRGQQDPGDDHTR